MVGVTVPLNPLETQGRGMSGPSEKVISWEMPRVSPVSETFSQEGPSSLLAKALGMELEKDQPHTELLVNLQGIY